MQRLLHGELLQDSGYFHIWISSVDGSSFFQTNVDRAFFISLVQDALSPRLKLSELNIKPQGYSAEIDLLAYSLTAKGVHLLVHTTRKTALEELGQTLLFSYQTYTQQHQALSQLPFNTIFTFDALAGRHDALHVSRKIHLLHEDWRYDRYSSIGFYLDDRRGDWMRPYRLTSLYDARQRQYLRFIKSQETESDRIFEYIEN